MHVCHDSTRQYVLGAYAIHRTWRNTAKALGYNDNFATVLSQVAAGKRGAISPEKEDELRERLGLFAIHGIRVAPCRTCGEAHTVGDCGGKQGAPIILGSGEFVRVQGKKRKPSPSWQRRARLRAACAERGITVEDAAEMWLRVMNS